ncbi:hypothetical protein [uncultured Bacteroides sp.]|uniref:hypothetical protein n=1 Tax=uncultured Bacteroides sp. TaxID=162156 RepID=UPI002AAAF420|nr:hypothetical protein [uncultured Bacteroides sp.]
MNRKIYLERKKYVRYTDSQFLVYLNEEIIPDYIPESHEEETPDPVTAYAYSGNLEDGGTIIEAKNDTEEEFISGLVKLRYSQESQLAIILNKDKVNDDKAEEHAAELQAMQTYRDMCKGIVGLLFAE